MQRHQDDYLAEYRSLKLTRDSEGVLVAEFHSNHGPFTFTAQDHTEFVDAFYRIAQDRANKIVILTGAGGDFIPYIDFSSFGNVADPAAWSQVHDEGVQIVRISQHTRSDDRGHRGTRPCALRVCPTCQCDCGSRGCDLPRYSALRRRHCARRWNFHCLEFIALEQDEQRLSC